MRALRSHIALLLLLCLTRTLLPEAWILALHSHQHTTEEPAQAAAFQGREQRPSQLDQLKSKALLSVKHQHCQVEHFYDVPLLATAPVVVPRPVVRACFALAPVLTVATAPWIAREPAQPRGPPAA